MVIILFFITLFIKKAWNDNIKFGMSLQLHLVVGIITQYILNKIVKACVRNITPFYLSLLIIASMSILVH